MENGLAPRKLTNPHEKTALKSLRKRVTGTKMGYLSSTHRPVMLRMLRNSLIWGRKRIDKKADSSSSRLPKDTMWRSSWNIIGQWMIRDISPDTIATSRNTQRNILDSKGK